MTESRAEKDVGRRLPAQGASGGVREPGSVVRAKEAECE